VRIDSIDASHAARLSYLALVIQTAGFARARLHLQRRLERGIPPGPWAQAAARLYASLVRVERPLRVTAPTLCIGGATLGGSGKTPLAIAAARALSDGGRRVVLVGHAYRARPSRARFVEPDDAVELVGDEALEAARELADTPARVVVAPTRQLAVDFAELAADVLVLDGPLQLTPRRAQLSWLAVDERRPWGSGACPPAGDLRAPRDSLVEAADAIVPVGALSRGVWAGGSLLGWGALRQRRLGLVTSVARPQRVVALLKRHGCPPARVLFGPDHGPLPPFANLEGEVDLWVTTGKDWALLRGAQAARIDYHLRLPPERLEELEAAFPPCPTASRF
jgi:tetraacyldisaccharide-1-P 4'-kinase